MKVLLVEDDQFKATRLRDRIREIDESLDIEEAHSVVSSTRLLASAAYSLVILDMSLPTFDVGVSESGGKPQGFGGREVLRFMSNNEISCPVIVVTQFERFAEVGREMNLESLSADLEGEFPELYRGTVFYDAASEKWRWRLSEIVESLLGCG